MTAPSPRPWRLRMYRIVHDDNEDDLFAVCGHDVSRDTDRANAAHIVRCVNAHEQLVEYLTGMCDLADEDEIAFLKKAKAFLEELKK